MSIAMIPSLFNLCSETINEFVADQLILQELANDWIFRFPELFIRTIKNDSTAMQHYDTRVYETTPIFGFALNAAAASPYVYVF